MKDVHELETRDKDNFGAIIRNAEPRGPYELGDDAGNNADLPLSELGMKQAIETGEYLREYFEDNNFNFNKIIIDSSPFLRCMQTAA